MTDRYFKYGHVLFNLLQILLDELGKHFKLTLVQSTFNFKWTYIQRLPR